jgi:ribosomal protein S18 acetylase RimI-like enzyme
MKYNEDKNIAELLAYIKSTYDQHYVGENNIQAIDVWESLGSMETSSRDTAIKYLMRYGKKEGKNRKDLLKALHYIILMMYRNDKESKNEKSKTL